MSMWDDVEDVEHEGWEYIGSLHGDYVEYYCYYCPEDGEFYVDRYYWNREGDEIHYAGYDSEDPDIIWNSLSKWEYPRRKLLEIAEKYGVSYEYPGK